MPILFNLWWKGANQAVAAARLGGSVTFVTALGNDMYADILKSISQKKESTRIISSTIPTTPQEPHLSTLLIVVRTA